MSLQQNNARNPLASMRHRGAGNPGRIEKSRNPKEALRRLLGYLAPFRIKLVTVSLLVIIYTALGLCRAIPDRRSH